MPPTRRATIPAARAGLTLVILLACAPDSAAQADADLDARARAIHERVLTLDTHVDIPFNYATPEVDPCQPNRYQVDIPKMEAGGLNAAFFIVYVGQTRRTPENYARAQADAMTKFEAIHRMTSELCPDRIELARTAADVERIWRSGKLVAAIGIENGYVIGTDLALLRRYHELGARYMTLAHNGHNDIADSTNPRAELGDERAEHGGLSEFGERVVAEMNRLGIMVDISHVSKDAMLHAVRVSRAPVIASHSSTTALAPVSRNMDDEQLLALKANGGVMQTVALGGFVRAPHPDRQRALAALRDELGIRTGADVRALDGERRAAYDTRLAEIERQWPSPTVADFVDHIDHAVRLIGIDHVGISSDFDGGGGVTGWSNASETLNVTRELVRRGYTEQDIAKLWGGNLLRVWREVERVAAELQATETGQGAASVSTAAPRPSQARTAGCSGMGAASRLVGLIWPSMPTASRSSSRSLFSMSRIAYATSASRSSRATIQFSTSSVGTSLRCDG
jgi:membrane dipeptidase